MSIMRSYQSGNESHNELLCFFSIPRDPMRKVKTSFLRNRTKMYQVDFQDFSDFAHNAYVSTLGQSISKNHNFRFSVAMDTKL